MIIDKVPFEIPLKTYKLLEPYYESTRKLNKEQINTIHML